MNEEIDIIELLKRVKEGKAPKRIQIGQKIYTLRDLEKSSIEEMYYMENSSGYTVDWFANIDVYIDTKIKILDKPKIEKLTPVKYGNVVTVPDRDVLMNKINEIIDYLNKNV